MSFKRGDLAVVKAGTRERVRSLDPHKPSYELITFKEDTIVEVLSQWNDWNDCFLTWVPSLNIYVAFVDEALHSQEDK